MEYWKVNSTYNVDTYLVEVERIETSVKRLFELSIAATEVSNDNIANVYWGKYRDALTSDQGDWIKLKAVKREAALEELKELLIDRISPRS